MGSFGSDRFTGQAFALDPLAERAIDLCDNPVSVVGPNLGAGAVTPVLTAPALGRLLRAKRIEVVHAWGVSAALTASVALRRSGGARSSLVVELFDPALNPIQLKILRMLVLAPPFALVCSSQAVRRAAIEGGVAPDQCVVIRPRVDFGSIGVAQKSSLRQQLGARSETTLVTVLPSERLDEPLLQAVWGAGLLNQLGHQVRIALRVSASIVQRLSRIVDGLSGSAALFARDTGERFEDLIAVSDALVLPARDTLPTTSIAWAMAAGTLIIGPAVRGVAELIANKHNGLLFNPKSPEGSSIAITRLLRDRRGHANLLDVARGEAYEIFGGQRYVDQHVKLYKNLQAGQSASEGITDSAIVA